MYRGAETDSSRHKPGACVPVPNVFLGGILTDWTVKFTVLPARLGYGGALSSNLGSVCPLNEGSRILTQGGQGNKAPPRRVAAARRSVAAARRSGDGRGGGNMMGVERGAECRGRRDTDRGE